MKVAVDLHIHSALSPCSDKDMTPNNIVNMSVMKGLDFIAITDHNSIENIEEIIYCARNKDLIVVPGMELETSEEIHVVCLFPDCDAAYRIQDIVYNSLPDMENREDIFGQQLIMDNEDNIKGKVERLLLTATGLSLDEVNMKMNEIGGVMIPAHIDRESYSVLSNLGMIPDNLRLKYLEVSKCCKMEKLEEKLVYSKKFFFIRSSDAHRLEDIMERESFLNIDDRSIISLLKELKS